MEVQLKHTKKGLFFKNNKAIKEWKKVIAFILPGMILLAIFVVYPLFKNVYMSFTEYNILMGRADSIVGFKNYIKAFHDQKVFLSLQNTILYGVVTILPQMIIGLVLAVIINSISKGKLFFKVLYYIPVITSWVIVSLVFRYLFESGKGGMINYILMNLHFISEPISWISSRWTANVIIWVLAIWKGVGWVMIVYMAALQGISKYYYESAEIDGANFWQKFFYITIPSVKPITFYILVNLVIGSFNVFVQILMITNGQPMGRTEVLLSYMYKVAFKEFNFGYSSALAVLMGLFIFTITMLQYKCFRKE